MRRPRPPVASGPASAICGTPSEIPTSATSTRIASERAASVMVTVLEPEWRIAFVANSQASRTTSSAIVTGFLQREEYARALLNGDEAAVAARLERQEILSRDNPPTLRCVIDEMAFYRQVGDAAVMRAQLEYLER
jgi:hypothetical protein